MHLKKFITVCGVAGVMTLLLIVYSNNSVHTVKPGGRPLVTSTGSEKYSIQKHSAVIEEYFAERKNLNLSHLGRYLFLNEKPPPARKKTFKILVWKDGNFLERRHIRHFSETKQDPFESSRCSVKNCALTYDNADLPNADAVVFLLHRLQSKDLPPAGPRPPHQRWVFLSDESPIHTFLLGSNNNNWKAYLGIFNWSMTYKMESDVPVPYGRTVALPDEQGSLGRLGPDIMSLVPHKDIKRRDVLVSAMISNCGKNNMRMDYVKELQKHIQVDVYGACGDKLKTKCPGHFAADCPLLDNYLFHLAFENSNCDQYFTEKVFWNSYNKGAVPVILGPKTPNARLLLPPDSYINTWGIARPADLARLLLFLNETWDEEFFKLHEWRRHFGATNEHGYFGSPSYHYCRLCEALNYNDEQPKVYDDLSEFLDVNTNCHVTADWGKDIEKQ